MTRLQRVTTLDLLRPAIIDLVQLLDTEGVLALATHLTERKY